MEMGVQPFGQMPDGTEIREFVFSNVRGVEARAITYGATMTSLMVPDREDRRENVILGFDTLEEYLRGSEYFGAVVGRYANRIAGGRFTLDGVEHVLACNETPGAGAAATHLHGGNRGFDKVVWQARPFRSGTAAGVRFSYRSPDGEEGYPGTLKVAVTYRLSEDNELSFEYQARTDRPTPVNLTQHNYWNLAGAGAGPVADHLLRLDCPFYLPSGRSLTPTGEILRVEGTPMDFTSPRPIGQGLSSVPGGYDHCWVAGRADQPLAPIAAAVDPASGRAMEVWTTMPGVQFYTSNALDRVKGAGGKVYERHGAFCLETQFFPDSPNQPHFPSTILRPGGLYRHRTVHRFSTRQP